jgi:hypothetical protein
LRCTNKIKGATKISHTFETLSNASVLVRENGQPILATDPWLFGTCYFGSWALDHPLSEGQLATMRRAEYFWISHGHPDHLHHDSLASLPRGKKILLPDHYSPEIADSLRAEGFEVTILKYRQWFALTPTVRVMCIDNMNQDGILLIQAGDSLILDLNDSPLCGETPFIRRIVRQHKRENTYLLALCAIDADMFNFVGPDGKSLAGPPDERKRGMIWRTARIAETLGVGSFCVSSSQHIYIRSDSVWANPYRVTFADISQHWHRPDIRIVEPFVTVDLDTCAITRNHPAQTSDNSQITATTAEDDWSETLSADEWQRVEAFMRKFQLVRRYVDFVAFTVGGESRQFDLNPPNTRPADKRRGIEFIVPRNSLMETVTWGYFDDLLIGNFMKTRLINTQLYPRFSPLVAKIGGNAKVFTRPEYYRFLGRYFRRNPIGTAVTLLSIEVDQVWLPWLRRLAEGMGVKRPLKYLYRKMLGDPIVPDPS